MIEKRNDGRRPLLLWVAKWRFTNVLLLNFGSSRSRYMHTTFLVPTGATDFPPTLAFPLPLLLPLSPSLSIFVPWCLPFYSFFLGTLLPILLVSTYPVCVGTHFPLVSLTYRNDIVTNVTTSLLIDPRLSPTSPRLSILSSNQVRCRCPSTTATCKVKD